MTPGCFPVQPLGLNDPQAAAGVVRSVPQHSWLPGTVCLAACWVPTAAQHVQLPGTILSQGVLVGWAPAKLSGAGVG